MSNVKWVVFTLPSRNLPNTFCFISPSICFISPTNCFVSPTNYCKAFLGAGFSSHGRFFISRTSKHLKLNFSLRWCHIYVAIFCWHLPVCLDVLVAPTNISRCICWCQHWVPTPSVGTYQYV